MEIKLHPSSGNSCCGNGSSLPRRDFIKATGLTVAMMMAGRINVMAGPFDSKDFDQIIPADKKLSKEWIASLYARGQPMRATGDDLKYIGMPINGICTGQVYLGGDGRLWHWNLDATRDMKIHTAKGPQYMNPTAAQPPIGQGFALLTGTAGEQRAYALDATGFESVTFTNRYPMATVDYADASCPVAVQLQAYTPFVPLNRDDSSYPVTVLRYTIKNKSSDVQDVAIAGWIDSISNAKSGAEAVGQKRCEYREFADITTVECSAAFPRAEALESKPDFGSIALGLLGSARPEIVNLDREVSSLTSAFSARPPDLKDGTMTQRDFHDPSTATMGRVLTLKPGEARTVSFAVSWRFPHSTYMRGFGPPKNSEVAANHYATLWPTAAAAAHTVAARESELHNTTQSWVDTWYDSTLPHWFLERSFVTLDCIQTQMGQRFVEPGGEEHYNFEEGVKCCPGNCTHVWNYAQGLARIFPAIERECRDKVEYGLGFDDTNGMVYFRYTLQEGKDGRDDAIDGTCGTIIRVLRESQMTTDYRFLAGIWERVKLSMDFVIKEWDADEDGMLAGAQHNTLDEPWYGQVHWLTNVYHAALKASAVMARQMKQPAVAARYERIVQKGAPAMVDQLWNEAFGYFIHQPGEADSEKHGSTNGCHIDQILGDSWLHEVGLDPILPQDKIRQTLQSLWKYNFTPDVGAFRKVMTNGRWYAGPGDAGLVMCSFPHGKIEPKSGHKGYAGYLNECMTGFEWQVAAHMIREGMLEEGLAIGKAIHDRYHPKDRNPYNEIECSDHYSRAMASYGAFLAVCGYRYDGPEGKLGFGPKLRPDDFRAAFTTAEGWGRFTQKVVSGEQSASIDLHYGRLHLRELTLDKAPGNAARTARVRLAGKPVEAFLQVTAERYVLKFAEGITIRVGERLELSLT